MSVLQVEVVVEGRCCVERGQDTEVKVSEELRGSWYEFAFVLFVYCHAW